MRGLYAIVDLEALEPKRLDPVDFAHRVLEAKPAAIQLRAKRTGARDTLELLRALLPPCRAAGVPLFANDRPDLAVLAGCDGVHVGQDDLSVGEARRIGPDLRIGISTHDPAQLRRAIADRPDYVAFGPVFITTSKDRPDPVVGLELLEVVVLEAANVGIPVVAIGGITLERARSVGNIASAGAVISALIPDEGLEGVSGRARALHGALSGAPS